MCFRKNGRGRRQKFFQGVCPKRQQRMKVAGNVNNFVWKSILLFYTMEKKKRLAVSVLREIILKTLKTNYLGEMMQEFLM